MHPEALDGGWIFKNKAIVSIPPCGHIDHILSQFLTSRMKKERKKDDFQQVC
jgi:hypothetical protein